MATTESACLDALCEAADRLGESPTKAQYEGLDITPASTTIYRIFWSWNDAKAKANLRTYAQDEKGGTAVEPNPDSVTIPDDGDWRELTAQQRWYYKNRRHRIEVNEQRRGRLREWFFRLKRDSFACERCEETRPATLDFHHSEPKLNGVSQTVSHGYSKRRIREEMDRCVVLCANCHREEHTERSEDSDPGRPNVTEGVVRDPSENRVRERRRNWVKAYKQDSEGCTRCAVADPGVSGFSPHRGKD